MENSTVDQNQKESGLGHLVLKYLPKYANFLYTHHLERFTNEIIRLSNEEEVSYIKNFESLTDEQYFKLNLFSNERLLRNLSEHNLGDFIKVSTGAYIKNRLPLVDKEDILAEDIIKHSMIIRKALRHFLKEYNADFNYSSLIMDDVDTFTAAYKVSLFNAYLNIQKAKIQKVNEDLLLAQKLSKMGSFSWDLQTGQSELTASANDILMLDKPVSLEMFFSYVHPDYRTAVKEALDNAVNSNGNYECEYSYVKDGIEKRIHAVGVITYADGKPLKMRGCIVDKTTTYKMIQKLKQTG